MIAPMDFGEILDMTIRVAKSGWKPLLLIGLLNAIPWVIYQGLVRTLMPTNVNLLSSMSNPMAKAISGAMRGNWSGLLQFVGAFLVLVLLMALLFPWLKGAMIVIASRLYLGQPVTLGSGLRAAGRRYFALLATGLLVVAFSLVATVGLIIGGFLFLAGLTVPVGLAVLWVYLAFNRHAILLESGGGGLPAIRRSFGLVNGRFWPLLGMGIVFYLFAAALTSEIAFISQIPAQLVQTYTKNPDLVRVLTWVVAVLSGLLQGLAAPFYTVGLTLVYYDTRMRKEGFDIELMAENQVAK